MNIHISKAFKILLISVLFSALAACSEDVILLGKLSEGDANEVMGALLSVGVPAKKLSDKKTGYSVSIEAESMSRAVSTLKAAGLPNRAQVTLGDVFKKEGVISTPLEERARYIYALSQELEHTISQIDNVVLARVHVVLPERVAPGQPIQPSSAAVFIKHLPILDPDVISPRVLSMVSKSIPGLSEKNREKIAISFVETAPAVSGIQWATVGPFVVQKHSASSLLTLIALLSSASIFALLLAMLMTLAKTRVWVVTKFPRLEKFAI